MSLTDQANGYVIADAVMFLPPGSSPNSAAWTPNVPAAGQYEVFARWTATANRATNAPYAITHAGGTTQVAVNQQANNGVWNSLGTYTFSPGAAHKVTLTDQANGYVIADGVRLVPVSIPTGPQMYYVSADHLNTPRLVADATGTTVWRWDQQEPFGLNAADENPSGLGAFDLPLRLPGQRYDAETGLHYNYFRDYDPTLGIYKQGDPIGFEGGINTYSYAAWNPLRFLDRFGLTPTIDELIEVLKKKFCRKFDEECRDYYLRLIRYCQRMHVPALMACRHAADALYEQCAANEVPVCKPPPTSCFPGTTTAGVS